MRRKFIHAFSIASCAFALIACDPQNKKDDKEENKEGSTAEARALTDSAVSVATAKRDYAAAITLLEKAIESDSNYFEAHANKLSYHHQLGQYDKALATAQQMNRLDPGNADISAIIARLYDRTGNTAEANKHYSAAIEGYSRMLDTTTVTDPQYPFILLHQAMNLELSGDTAKAAETYNKAMESAPDEPTKTIIRDYMQKDRAQLIKQLEGGK